MPVKYKILLPMSHSCKISKVENSWIDGSLPAVSQMQDFDRREETRRERVENSWIDGSLPAVSQMQDLYRREETRR